jgi:hypothetical protein
MISDTRWRRHLSGSPSISTRFNSAVLLAAHRAGAASVRANVADDVRASANIAAWRAYLPEGCVAAMIKDGWQWST